MNFDLDKLGVAVPPVDENFLRQKQSEGMADDVIEYYHRDSVRTKVLNFLSKSEVLKKHSSCELSYYDFMDLVYEGAENELLVVTSNETYQTMNADDLIDYMKDRDDVYVSPCTFINGCYKTDTCKNVYALVIDIDNVSYEVIDNILKNGTLGKRIPMPTIITNSGQGLHFYYVFKERIPFYKKQRRQLSDIYRRLYGVVKNNIYAKADWHSMIQPFRLPGSLTKLGMVAKAYQFNEKWSVADLSGRLGFDEFEWDLNERKVMSQQEHREYMKELKEKGRVSKKKKNNMQRRKGLQGFYDYSFQRTLEKTVQGHRYKSMLALTMIGYKARIPKEELEEDFKKLAKHYNEIGNNFSEKEIKKALKAYNIKAEKATSVYLEEMFGWEFERLRLKFKQKLNKSTKSRAEHLDYARMMKKVKKEMGKLEKDGRPNKQQQVKEWQKEHPNGTKAECNRDTKIDPKTIRKWWKED